MNLSPLPGAVRTVCAWCRVLIDDGALIDGRESHGICATCSAAMDAEIAKLEVA